MCPRESSSRETDDAVLSLHSLPALSVRQGCCFRHGDVLTDTREPETKLALEFRSQLPVPSMASCLPLLQMFCQEGFLSTSGQSPPLRGEPDQSSTERGAGSCTNNVMASALCLSPGCASSLLQLR